MGMALAIALSTVLYGSSAGAETRTFNLNYADAVGLPDVLDQLVLQDVDWVTPLQLHWAQLKGALAVDRERNALKAEGLPEALAALAQVLKVMDVPRPQVTLRYRRLKVPDPADLFGKPAAPPMGEVPSTVHGAAVNAQVTVGDWESRVAALVAGGKAETLNEGTVSVMDSYWATVWLGDPEAPQPEFCFQARPTVMETGALRLSLAYGTWRRTGRDPEPPGVAEGRGTPGEVCISCGPGLGVVVLVPELVLTTRLEAGQSVLVGGVAWALEDAGTLAGPADEWVVVSAAVEDAVK
ncbi:MAG: hypothetical protein FJX75_05050 [Armatimonadetes bacterium]|nr:hypothetical protein [Armatimonadota bacterium]